MCYYHPTGFRYAPSIPYQYFIRPCRQAKFYATQLAYPVSSGASGSGPGSPGTVSMQSTQGILVRPCSSHHVADEVAGSEGDGDADVDICMDVPLDFDVDPDGDGDEDGEDDEEDDEEEEEDEEESEEEEEEEDNDEMEYTSTGLAISVPITSIQPGSGPSLKDVKPKPRSKRFKRDLISMPVQLLRWKWKRTMALRYVKKKAADTTAAAVSSSSSSPSSAAGSQRPQMFNNNGFWSWHGSLPVQMQRHGQGWVQSPNGSFTYNSWDGRGLERIRAAGGFC